MPSFVNEAHVPDYDILNAFPHKLQPFPTVHFTSGRDLTPDVGDAFGRDTGIPVITGFGIAASRLSDHTSSDFVSGRKS